MTNKIEEYDDDGNLIHYLSHIRNSNGHEAWYKRDTNGNLINTRTITSK
jgi:YD repeat-containing protein